MTITLDDELVERAARSAAEDDAKAYGARNHWKLYEDRVRAAITAYLQGAVDAGKAVQDHMSELEELWVLDFAGARRSFPVLILRLPPQNPSSAESSAGTDGNSANK
jgi:hypothetical protein